MTIPPLRDAITYWTVAIDHDDNFNGWPVKAYPDEVFVSITGHPSIRQWAQFRSKEDAERFLAVNREVLEHRCAEKIGFRAFRIGSGNSFWSVTFDDPVELKRPRSLR